MSLLSRALTAVGLSAASLLTAAEASAQAEIGVHLGHAYYMGDLQAEQPFAPLGSGKASYGVYARLGFSDLFALTVSATATKIAGDDAQRQATHDRNLSFQSDILEVGLSGEFFPLGSARAVSPYLTAGAAVYRFNPRAEYNGRLVDLQPLGTEGQGMPGYAPKYSLTRLAMPLGVGVRVPFGESWVITAEAKLRATFFDHLDDLSGAYVNYYELVQGNGSLAAALADRTGERLGIEPRDIPSGRPRGKASNFDYYATAGINIGYRLGAGLFSAGSRRGSANRYNKCYQF